MYKGDVERIKFSASLIAHGCGNIGVGIIEVIPVANYLFYRFKIENDRRTTDQGKESFKEAEAGSSLAVKLDPKAISNPYFSTPFEKGYEHLYTRPLFPYQELSTEGIKDFESFFKKENARRRLEEEKKVTVAECPNFLTYLNYKNKLGNETYSINF